MRSPRRAGGETRRLAPGGSYLLGPQGMLFKPCFVPELHDPASGVKGQHQQACEVLGTGVLFEVLGQHVERLLGAGHRDVGRAELPVFLLGLDFLARPTHHRIGRGIILGREQGSPGRRFSSP